MSELFGKNLTILRKAKKLQQAEMPEHTGVSRATWSDYERGKTEPDFATLLKIAEFFRVTADELLSKDLSQSVGDADAVLKNKTGKIDADAKNLPDPNRETYQLLGDEITGLIVAEPVITDTRYFAPNVIIVDNSGEENVPYVPVKARTGYLQGYHDPAFIEKLPVYHLPGYQQGSYRIFEIEGASMIPTLQDRDRVVARWHMISEIMDDRLYVMLTKQNGLLVKRVTNRYQDNKLICKSDNPVNSEYPSIVLDIHDVIEAWCVVERWTRQLPGPDEVYKRISLLETEVTLLKHRINKGSR